VTAPPSAPIRPSADVLFDQDFITIYQALPPALCADIVERFEADERKTPGRIYRQGAAAAQVDDIKNSWDLEILNDERWGDLFRRLHGPVMTCLDHYLSRSPVLQSFPLQGTGYKIQMYPRQQGWFHWHADSTAPNARSRVVSLILYLNDVLEGGQTEFMHQGIRVSPRAGQLLMFPAGWNHVHRGCVPESGDKYIVQTFVKIKD
jgi:hypothetical protein